MTPILSLVRKKKRTAPETVCFCLLLFLFVLLLQRTTDTATAIQKGLSLCVGTLIPSLFPFLVLSRIAMTAELSQLLPAWIRRLGEKLLHLSSAGCSALLLGCLCGFPTGAACVSSAYGKGELSLWEGERVLLLSGIPSLGFLLSAVGTGLWGDRAFGRALLGILLISSLAVTFLFYPPQKKEEHRPPVQPVGSPLSPSLFTDALWDSALNMLRICAYVVFFCGVSGVLSALLTHWGAPPAAGVLLSGLLELSGGVKAASMLDNRATGMLLTAFFCGWSGLSVHFQALSMISPCPLRIGRYLAAKVVQGLIAAALCGVYLLLTK